MNAVLRPWRLDDAADLARVLSNPKILDRLRDGLPYPYTADDARDYITSMLFADPRTTFARAVCCDGRVIGSIGAFRQGNVHRRTAELGYYLAEPYWGRGIMPAAVRELCGEIFAETDIIRVFAEPFADNTASCRVLEKAGFIYEGTLRANVWKNGRILDMRLYARVKEGI